MIKLLRQLFCLSLIILVFSSTSYAGRRPPKWVKNRPVSSEYYIGVSVVSKDVENYMQLAKNKALQDLASQISINISSNSVLHQFEPSFILHICHMLWLNLLTSFLRIRRLKKHQLY